MAKEAFYAEPQIYYNILIYLNCLWSTKENKKTKFYISAFLPILLKTLI